MLRAVVIVAASAVPAFAQDFAAGEPIGAVSEAGEWRPMSDNVTVYGSFSFLAPQQNLWAIEGGSFV